MELKYGQFKVQLVETVLARTVVAIVRAGRCKHSSEDVGHISYHVASVEGRV